MRRTTLVPLVAIAALVLAGCGEESAQEPPADADATGGTGQPGDGGDPGDQEPGAASRAAFDERAEQIAADWPEVEPSVGGGQDLLPLEGADPPASSDAEGLTVHVGHGDCDADFGVWVEETEDLVILGGWSVPDPEAEVCNDMLVIDPVEVELDAELGGRIVVDAVHGTDLFEERFPPLD